MEAIGVDMTTMCVNLADVGSGRRPAPRARGVLVAPLAAVALAAAAALWPARAAADCWPLSSSPVTFSAYTPFGAGASATGRITYLCWGNTRARMGISIPRTMRSGANSLQFELYQDAAHTVRFPDTALVDVPLTLIGSITVYGLLPPQDAAPGAYTAQLTATIANDGQPSAIGLTVNTTGFVPSCIIQPAVLAFGDYNPLSTTPGDAQATITIACTRSTTYSVALGAGSHAAGTTRQMANGADRLQYELYSDAARLTAWTGTSTVAGTAASTAPIPLVVYGRIPARQLVRAGAYGDVVQSTINF